MVQDCLCLQYKRTGLDWAVKPQRTLLLEHSSNYGIGINRARCGNNFFLIISFFILKETKINTCTIYLLLIFLKYKMLEIVARKACMYFVATV